jgi:hypothetical protein
VDADGDAVFVWRRYDGANQRVQARVRSKARVVLTLSEAGQHAADPQVAVDTDGDAVFVWRRYDGTNWRVQARVRSAGGRLGPIHTLSEAGWDAVAPQVAADADGDPVFVWASSRGRDWRILARAGVLGPIETLYAARQETSYPQVAVDANGDAVFVWSSASVRILARASRGAQRRSDPGPRLLSLDCFPLRLRLAV